MFQYQIYYRYFTNSIPNYEGYGDLVWSQKTSLVSDDISSIKSNIGETMRSQLDITFSVNVVICNISQLNLNEKEYKTSYRMIISSLFVGFISGIMYTRFRSN